MKSQLSLIAEEDFEDSRASLLRGVPPVAADPGVPRASQLAVLELARERKEERERKKQ
jgi:hypothetical protein